MVDYGVRTGQFDIGIKDTNYYTTATGFCGGYPSAMVGNPDEVAVFNYALSAGRVANIYAARDIAGSPEGISPGPVP